MLGNRKAQHSFAQIPDVKMARSSFDRSFAVKDAFDFDYLIPIFVDEVIPGDTFNVTLHSFARLATQVVPVMDNMYMDYFFFFVPNRLVYDKWERLCGAQIPDPDSTTDFIMPKMTAPASTGFTVGSLFDKLGLPTGAASCVVNNTLPIRCYNKIWTDWFKDQWLQDGVVLDIDEGPDSPGDYSLLKRGKRHDYFTSCLPEPQKGPAVTIPLSGGSAPVKGLGINTHVFPTALVGGYDSAGDTVSYTAARLADSTTNNILYVEQNPANS